MAHSFFLKPEVNDKIIDKVSNRRAAYLREKFLCIKRNVKIGELTYLQFFYKF
jgi:hypothetical protein